MSEPHHCLVDAGIISSVKEPYFKRNGVLACSKNFQFNQLFIFTILQETQSCCWFSARSAPYLMKQIAMLLSAHLIKFQNQNFETLKFFLGNQVDVK